MLCIDYQKLNAQLPLLLWNKTRGATILVDIQKIDKLLARDRDSKYFTSIDLQSRYYHIKLGPKTRHKSAFTTMFWKVESLWMPFRLEQGPTYFIALMQNVFGSFTDFCFFHMDDVLVHNFTEKDNLRPVKIIFEKFHSKGLQETLTIPRSSHRWRRNIPSPIKVASLVNHNKRKPISPYSYLYANILWGLCTIPTKQLMQLSVLTWKKSTVNLEVLTKCSQTTKMSAQTSSYQMWHSN